MSLENETKLHLLAQHLGETKLGENSILRIIWEAHINRQETARALLCLLEGYLGELSEIYSVLENDTFVMSYNEIKRGVKVSFNLVYTANELGEFNMETTLPIASEIIIEKAYARNLLDDLIKEHFASKDQ